MTTSLDADLVADHQLAVHRDPTLEAVLTARGIEWTLGLAPIVDVDWAATTAGQVRKVDAEVVWQYVDSMRAGEAFPAVLATRGDDGWIVIGGQHRLRAWDEVPVTEIPAYQVDVPDPALRYILGVEHNTRHGSGLSADERVAAAVRMIDDHGLTQAAAAAHVGLTVSTLRSALKASSSAGIVQRLGIISQWRRLSASSQLRIGMVARGDETLFMEAVACAANLRLKTGDVYELAEEIVAGRRQGGEAGALQAVEDFEAARHAEATTGTSGGWGKGAGGRPGSGSGKGGPAVAWRRLVLSLMDIPAADVVGAVAPDDRRLMIDTCERVARRAVDIARSLHTEAPRGKAVPTSPVAAHQAN